MDTRTCWWGPRRTIMVGPAEDECTYSVQVELNQDVQLVRDENLRLEMVPTWRLGGIAHVGLAQQGRLDVLPERRREVAHGRLLQQVFLAREANR